VLDEVETIQRMNAQTREKSLNALRQLMDMLAKEELPGLYLVVTGTRDFFEGYKGLKAWRRSTSACRSTSATTRRFDNLRAPQVRLLPFTDERLLTVGRASRPVPVAKNPEPGRHRVDDPSCGRSSTQVTTGFGGKVALAPRLFLRELIDVLDRVDLHQDYDPAAALQARARRRKLTTRGAGRQARPVLPKWPRRRASAAGPPEPTPRREPRRAGRLDPWLASSASIRTCSTRSSTTSDGARCGPSRS
jgi:hypothetical protein